jgi:hypothetical protein
LSLTQNLRFFASAQLLDRLATLLHLWYARH